MNRSLRLVFLFFVFSCILPLATTTIATTAEGAEGSVSSSDNTNITLDRNPPTMSEGRDTPITNNHGGTNSPTH